MGLNNGGEVYRVRPLESGESNRSTAARPPIHLPEPCGQEPGRWQTQARVAPPVRPDFVRPQPRRPRARISYALTSPRTLFCALNDEPMLPKRCSDIKTSPGVQMYVMTSETSFSQ
ncbi:hypothetical protein Bbelb_034060 [Branchiostoma belcheri]|nr:hypothetical protein Bbelb_034060 [Branchiostoma belcheri]